MLSHSCFILALLVYYIPKAFGKKTRLIVNMHIVLGCLAIIGMIAETVMKFGTESLLKYVGFSIVMLAIGGTGYLVTKQGRRSLKWHVLATLSFVIYLVMIIIL